MFKEPSRKIERSPVAVLNPVAQSLNGLKMLMVLGLSRLRSPLKRVKVWGTLSISFKA